MCGCKISGKRKRIGARKGGFSMDGLQNTIVNDVLPGAAGYVAGEVLDKQLTLFAKNNTTASLIKVGGGLALSAFADGFLAKVGVGLAVNGAAGLALPALEKAGIAQISLLPPGERSYYLAGTPAAVKQQERVVMQ